MALCPSNVGTLHDRLTVVLVAVMLLWSITGALGTVGIKADPPTADSGESPIALVAMTFASTVSPDARLYLDALSRVVSGMLHDLLDTTLDWDPSQDESATNVPSDFFTRIVYAVMGVPPLSDGAVQLMSIPEAELS